MRNLSQGDAAIGARLREARIRRGLSQAALGEHLGVTFQQVQKYENGKNRIAAGKLSIAARVLELPYLYFFDPHEGQAPPPISRQAFEVVQIFEELPPAVRTQVVALVRAIRDAHA